MSRDPVGRRGVRILESAGRLDPGTILTTILVLGLVVRVFIAGVYLPLSGFAIDIGDFAGWGQRLASLGPGAFYEEGYFSDYPPGFLYVLWILGVIGGMLAPIVGQDATPGLVKIPGILADIGVAWLLFSICRRWGGQLVGRHFARVDPTSLGLVAATIYLFNPGTIFNSAVWGQIDSVGALVLLATIHALASGRTELAALGAVVALLVKFQFAFLVPVVAVVGIKRHLFARSTDPRLARRDPLRVVTSLAVGFGAVTVLMLPFRMFLYAPLAGGDPRGLLGLFPEADPTRSLIGKFVEAAGTYTGLTVNAFNLWRNPFSGLGDTLHWGDDTVVALTVAGLSLTWQHVGTALFAAAALLALWQVARRDDLRGILLAALVLAIAFFVFPTRVHERYLFPALALAAPLVLSGRAWPWIYGALSLSFFANVYWVYTADWSFAGRILTPGVDGLPMARDPFLATTVFTDVGTWGLSFLSVIIFAAVAWHAVAAAREGVSLPPEPMKSPSTLGSVPGVGSDVDRRAERATGPGWINPNPADAYLREPRRGLDRRDALFLLALVAFALVFRLWRLDVPRAQHFDEVYHARSAAEFLSSWRHGWDRDVYEWTHPMLAKYLIAGGIVLADPNRIVDTHTLDEPSIALAVAPRRTSLQWEQSIVFRVAAPSMVIAAEGDGGAEVARWHIDGPIASLAYDDSGPRLLVGRADGGRVETFEIAALLASPDGRAPPAGPPIESDLEAVSEIVVPGHGSPILLRGPNGVALVDPDRDTVDGQVAGTYGGVAYVTAHDDEPARIALTDARSGEVVFVDADTFAESSRVAPGPALIGPLAHRGSGDDQHLFALTGALDATEWHSATAGGIAAFDADGSDTRCGGTPCLIGVVPLPGAGSLIGHQSVAGILYVAGTGNAGDPELWALERHVERRGDGTIGLAAFDTTRLSGMPVAMAFDVAATSQSDDRGRLHLSVVDGTGTALLTEVDAGSNAFAWRLAGVVFGTLLVALVYLLGATMFSRRRIAILAAAFVAVDGMSYTMSRISMNDIFVATFVVAAYLVFWQIWSGRWQRSAWWALPLTGVLVGLAAASKWAGFYALAGLLVLVLARSGLGRLVLVGLVVMATVVGGIGAPWPFLAVMVGISVLALAISWARPVRVHAGEALAAVPATLAVATGLALAFALAHDSIDGPEPAGAVEYVFSLLARGAEAGWPAWLLLGTAAALVAWRAWLSVRDPGSDARWHQPGEMGGFSWSWVGACLVIIPLTVYALSYVPYLQLGHAFAIPDTGPGYGWSLEQLHRQMYGYHFNLTAGHASASPWWSWPLVLKPTWLFNGVYDGNQVATIYNGGNPILLWAGVPALAACGVLAWKRRSAALVLIVAAFAFQFVPWIRIERATFAYHYLTALPFALLAVAYVVDELLRRPAWRQLAIGYLVLAAVIGLLVFPLGAALPMPDWYVNAARALPPWNYGFQFPDPPSGDRGELLSASALTALLGLLAAVAAAAFAMVARDRWERRRSVRTSAPPIPEGS